MSKKTQTEIGMLCDRAMYLVLSPCSLCELPSIGLGRIIIDRLNNALRLSKRISVCLGCASRAKDDGSVMMREN